MSTIAERIYKYAERMYDDGWDFVVESWTIEDIEVEVLECGLESYMEARNHFKELKELRQEAFENAGAFDEY
jgi:hypothetical protein